MKILKLILKLSYVFQELPHYVVNGGEEGFVPVGTSG